MAGSRADGMRRRSAGIDMTDTLAVRNGHSLRSNRSPVQGTLVVSVRPDRASFTNRFGHERSITETPPPTGGVCYSGNVTAVKCYVVRALSSKPPRVDDAWRSVQHRTPIWSGGNA